MHAVRNDHCFSEPHWRLKARGFAVESWFERGKAIGNAGMMNPQVTELSAGHFYYRFANSMSPIEKQIGGEWWISFDQFQTVRAFAEQHEYSLKAAARLLLALPYDWPGSTFENRVDLLVRAQLIEPLKAYTGLGKPAQGKEGGRDGGTSWIPTQHIQIQQLFIPGLFVPCERPRPQLYETAWRRPAEFTRLW